MTPTFATQHLSFQYQDGETVLHDLSLDFSRGQVTGLLGANGCGKSTLFMNLLGILQPQQGAVLWQGKNWAMTNVAYVSYASRLPWFSGTRSTDLLYRHRQRYCF